MKKSNLRLIILLSLVILAALLPATAGCGDEGSKTASTATATPAGDGKPSTISGTAVKGPVSGGMVTAYSVSDGNQGSALASGPTDGQGNFSVKYSGYSGPVMLTMTGGAYQDEATGTMMSMGADDMMTTAIPYVSNGETVSGVQITPLTSMAQSMAGNMPGSMSTASIEAANMAMGQYFMVNDILYTKPMDPMNPNSGTGATQDMRNYGMAMAGMSQYAKNLGMTPSSGMVTAMMNDASDGIMNGMMMGGNPVPMGGGAGMMGGGSMMQSNAGMSGMAGAMAAFMNSPMNKSGLTTADMQAMIDRMNASSGMIKRQ
jgi:hypothetical protein